MAEAKVDEEESRGRLNPPYQHWTTHYPTSSPPPSYTSQCDVHHFHNDSSTCKVETDENHVSRHRSVTSSYGHNDMTSQSNSNYFFSSQPGLSGAGQTSGRYAEGGQHHFSTNFGSFQPPLQSPHNFAPPMFPSMNVNVSMNMNLHGLPASSHPPQTFHDVNGHSETFHRDWSGRMGFYQPPPNTVNTPCAGDSGSESEFASQSNMMTSQFASHVSSSPASAFRAEYGAAASQLRDRQTSTPSAEGWRAPAQPVRFLPFASASLSSQRNGSRFPRLFSSFGARHGASSRFLSSQIYDLPSRLGHSKFNECPVCRKT